MNLYPYQEAGVDWFCSHATAGNADEAGLGKTAQALRAAAKAGAQSVGVLCPAVARAVWKSQRDLWVPGAFKEYTVESYDGAAVVQKTRSRLIHSKFDVLILDEAHYLKSPTSQRTRVVYGPAGDRRKGIASRADRVWIMSATPAPNHIGEHFTHLRALRPDLIQEEGKTLNLNGFLRRYAHYEVTRWGYRVLGVKRADEIKAILHQLWIRRKVEDVLPDLPPWSWYDVPLTPADAIKALSTYESGHAGVVELTERMRLGGEDVDLDAGGAHLTTLRRLIGRLKAPLVAATLRDELMAGKDKIVVFGIHHEVLNALHSELSEFGVVQITGETPDNRRAEYADRFNTDPKCRVFIGQMQACGVAITLTAANQVAFVETDWTPENAYQAAKRVHRIGQKRPVFVRIFSLAGSIDEAVARVLARKSRLLQKTELGDNA